MTGPDTDYYRRRERQERAIAGLSIDPRIVAIHAAMAERYAALAQAGPSLAARDPVGHIQPA